jgi:hypothetical protein
MVKNFTWFTGNIDSTNVTILNKPIPYKYYFLISILTSLKNLLLNRKNTIGGHPSVTNSVISGFNKNNYTYNFNIQKIGHLNENVIILSNKHALKQAIIFKKMGLIKYLIVGPNFNILDKCTNSLLKAPQIDKYITHVNMVNFVKNVIHELKDKCYEWPAGVDCDFWKPIFEINKRKVILYFKDIQLRELNDHTINQIKNILFQKSKEYNFEVINITYGNYSKEFYLNSLQNSLFMIVLARNETQGIAWSEAWSCDVPTLIYNNIEPLYNGIKYDGVVAPYLTDNCGLYFKDTINLNQIINDIYENKLKFEPRKWCLNNLSDVETSKKLYNIVNQIY